MELIDILREKTQLFIRLCGLRLAETGVLGVQVTLQIVALERVDIGVVFGVMRPAMTVRFGL